MKFPTILLAFVILMFLSCTVIEQDCKTEVEVTYTTGVIDTVTVKGKTPNLHKNGCLYAQDDYMLCGLKSARKLNVTCKPI